MQCNAMQNNTNRYNYFEDTDDRAPTAFHQKARQYLTPHTNVDWTYKDKGDKIHHNIFKGVVRSIGILQDFAQVYNNIVISEEIPETSYMAGIEVNDPNSTYGVGQTAVCVYNNTIINGRLNSYWGKGTYVVNPYIYWYSNILDSPLQDGDWRYDMSLGDPYMMTDYIYDSSRVHIERNYNYNSLNSDQIRVTKNSGPGYGTMSMADYDSFYSTTNYSKASSEGGDNLYQGSSAGSELKTRMAHSVGSGKTISDGGIGADHPYLSGVTIPSYIGAAGPNDSGSSWRPGDSPDDAGWVDYVLSLSDSSNLIE